MQPVCISGGQSHAYIYIYVVGSAVLIASAWRAWLNCNPRCVAGGAGELPVPTTLAVADADPETEAEARQRPSAPARACPSRRPVFGPARACPSLRPEMSLLVGTVPTVRDIVSYGMSLCSSCMSLQKGTDSRA